MAAPDYSIPIPTDGRAALARAWLMLGLFALLGAGLFAFLLVLARSPFMQGLFPWSDFFRTVLVVHVDLSVLVWFIAFGGMLWTLNSTKRALSLGWMAMAIAAAGTGLMVLAPFTGESNPLMSNYVPVLNQNFFLVGLGVFGVGAALLTVRGLLAKPLFPSPEKGETPLRFGLYGAVVATALALFGFAWSSMTVPESLSGHPYFEMLFWGGGHVLQYTFTTLMLVAWLWLASAAGLRLLLSPRWVSVLLGVGLITMLFAPFIYYRHGVGSAEYVTQFTWLMQMGGGLAPLPLGVAVLWAALCAPRASVAQRPWRAALLASVLLFGIGGVIGFLIRGVNVTIPAHYHGSIVGVTLALMGLTYHLLPRLGYSQPNSKWATIQPWLYAGGQLLHIVGLAWLGSYGVQRKIADATQGMTGVESAARGLMGLGGLLAIIGGLVFLAVVYRAMRRR